MKIKAGGKCKVGGQKEGMKNVRKSKKKVKCKIGRLWTGVKSEGGAKCEVEGQKKVRGLRSVIKSKKEVKCKIGRGAKANG